MGNSKDSELVRTRDEASREDRDKEDRQSFSMGSTDSTVGKSSQRDESRPLALVQEIRSRVFHLFYEQPCNIRQPQPGEQFQVGDQVSI